MSAREMFEELGYECFDDREQPGLPLTILYKEPERTLGEYVAYIDFILPDKRWKTNISNIEKYPDLVEADRKSVV